LLGGKKKEKKNPRIKKRGGHFFVRFSTPI